MKRLALLVSLACATPALADEGMWTFDNFPSAQVKQQYGFEPTQPWLDKVRLGTVQIDDDSSGSFVSPDGLVMTNHHCVRLCAERLSNPKQDYVTQGFYAKTQAEERQCPAMALDELVEMTDVTARLQEATRGLSGQTYADALKAGMAKLEKDCATSDAVRCSVVTLYQGGRYSLYKYRHYTDVRLVFAPEAAAATFGGDPDNFEFPRYDLDAAFVRIYDQGQPAQTPHWFRFSAHGPREGELTFVSGMPGGTSRGLTVAQLEFQRDVELPRQMLYIAELRGQLTEFQNRGPEQKRVSSSLLYFSENRFKVVKGHYAALLDQDFFERKVAAERELRQKVDADPALKEKYGTAWDEVARAQAALRPLYDEYRALESGMSLERSQLFSLARLLVRSAEERPKANAQRLREYTDTRLPELQARLFSPAPISPELEVLELTFSLTRLREALGVDHPVVKKVLGKESPRSLALRLVRETKLRDVKARRALFEGGRAAMESSKDPMVRLAALVDPDARAVRHLYEDELGAIIHQNSERIAQARFAVYGTSTYPDANQTLRLSYGTVKGYVHNGRPVPAFTTFGGLFERSTGEEPFALPDSWLRARKTLSMETPLNLVSTHDIIGGNSGSPLLDTDAEIVGLIFDGNIHSLDDEYGYDGSLNRTISVH
ncbi:MAG: S46 family peptidase, partial [Archangium sp.]